MIQANNLRRCYGNLTAVADVSFNIAPGEVVGLLGHNGAGKTTIMKMLTGYLEPTAGTVRVENLEMGRDTPAIQARIGYLPENCPVWPEMTVIDFLHFQAALRKVPEPERNRTIASAISRTALKAKATDPIETLSRGYRQRVGVAQALLHNPDILILDEPTNGLDPTQIHQMRSLIRDLAKTATVIVSTHILQEVQAVCDRVLIMRAGDLVVDKRLEDLRESDRIRLVTGTDALPTLQALDHIRDIQTVRSRKSSSQDTPNLFEYQLRGETQALPGIANALVAANVPIHSITPEEHDLEKVFAEVNGEEYHG